MRTFSNAPDVRLGSRVALGDYDDIGHPKHSLAGMMRRLVAGAEGIDEHDEEVGFDERKIVVAAIPKDDVGLLLGTSENGGVVDAREHDAAGRDVRLVLLAFLDRAVGSIEIPRRRKALYRLALEIAIRHRMAQHGRSKSDRSQAARQPARDLALTDTGADGTHADHRQPRRDHCAVRAEQGEICPGSKRDRSFVHDEGMLYIAVGENDLVDRKLATDLRPDQHSSRIGMPEA